MNLSMLRLGAHESVAGGLHLSLERAESAGCASLQLWTKNSRQWEAPPLDETAIRDFKEARERYDIHPIVAHASYLINIASPDDALYERSVRALSDEVARCDLLEIPYLVLHPGAHTGSGVEAGHARAIAALTEVESAAPQRRVRVLLETTAGQGTALGGDFESLATLLHGVDHGDGLGICLDTCHAFAAGYELRTRSGYEATMAAFIDNIGLRHLHVIHLNDSRHPFGSRKDRHEHIGEGEIGREGFGFLLTDPLLDGLPGILETPKSEDLHEDRENLARLREAADSAMRQQKENGIWLDRRSVDYDSVG
jgi:deoxyribonuclease IV